MEKMNNKTGECYVSWNGFIYNLTIIRSIIKHIYILNNNK